MKRHDGPTDLMDKSSDLILLHINSVVASRKTDRQTDQQPGGQTDE